MIQSRLHHFIREVLLPQSGCPKVRPNSALLAAWNGTTAPASKAWTIKEEANNGNDDFMEPLGFSRMVRICITPYFYFEKFDYL